MNLDQLDKLFMEDKNTRVLTEKNGDFLFCYNAKGSYNIFKMNKREANGIFSVKFYTQIEHEPVESKKYIVGGTKTSTVVFSKDTGIAKLEFKRAITKYALSEPVVKKYKLNVTKNNMNKSFYHYDYIHNTMMYYDDKTLHLINTKDMTGRVFNFDKIESVHQLNDEIYIVNDVIPCSIDYNTLIDVSDDIKYL